MDAKLFSGLALGGLALLAAGSAQAAPVITFENIGGIGGSIAYQGTGGAAIGHDIVVNRITGTGTAANAGITLKCVNCKIEFFTGNNISEGPNTWTFDSNGLFAIGGTVATTAGKVIAQG